MLRRRRRRADPSLADLQRDLRKRKNDLIREAHRAIITNAPLPKGALDELGHLEKIEDSIEIKRRAGRRAVDLLAFGLTAATLAVLFFVRLPRAEVDMEVRTTGLEFKLDSTSSENLIPGEVGQILTLKRVVVSGVENSIPEDAADGDHLELRAATIDDRDKVQRNVDPSVRLFAVELPVSSSSVASASIAYSGNSRGVKIGIQSDAAVTAAFGRLVLAPEKASKESRQSAVEQISIMGKRLDFTLFSTDEARDLAIFRNTRLTSISFAPSGFPEILAGEIYVRGRGETSPIILRPSDSLHLRSERPMILRELSLSGGQLKAMLSVPEATTVQLGETSARDLRPTLLQWIFYKWPSELYVALAAIVALWLSIRRWWEDPK